MFEPSTIIFGFNFVFVFIVDGIGYGGGNQDIHRQAENLAGFYFCPARIFNGGFFLPFQVEAKFFVQAVFVVNPLRDYR